MTVSTRAIDFLTSFLQENRNSVLRKHEVKRRSIGRIIRNIFDVTRPMYIYVIQDSQETVSLFSTDCTKFNFLLHNCIGEEAFSCSKE